MEAIANGRIQVKDLLNLVIRLKTILIPYRLKARHYHALLLLQENPGMMPGKMTQKLSILPAATTRVLNRLAKAGLIERQFGEDRRTTPTYLTKQGISLIKKIDQRFLQS